MFQEFATVGSLMVALFLQVSMTALAATKIWICVYVCVCVWVRVHMCVCVGVCVYMWVCTCVYVCELS